MTSKNPEPHQIRPIRRKQVQQYLAISAFIATQLITGCSSDMADDDAPDAPETQAAETTVPALFYETTEQCEAHAKKQQDQYAAKLKAYQEKQPPTTAAQPTAAEPTATPTPAATPVVKSTPTAIKPTPPVMKAADCAPQMAAARQEHDRHAPVYQTLSECQADDVQCEATPVGYATSGYRPMFGGTYFYPYGRIYGNPYGGSSGFANGSSYSSSSHFYTPRTVYRGFDAGSVVTPQGTVLSKSNPGVAIVPHHTSLAAPARPSGYTARGTITGRSNTTGFGSTFKSTGRGGK
jgi:uncharacterized protein YgiB involved in biofilm formation